MTSPLRVCHLSTLTRWGGVERMLVDLLLDQSPGVAKHLLVATSSAPEILASLQEANVPMLAPSRRWRYDVGGIFEVAQWLRQQRVQVVHAYNAFANVWGYLAASLARVPIFISGEHGSIWSVRGSRYQLDRWAQRRADAVIANSRASSVMLQARYGLPSAKIHVVANGIPELPSANVEVVRAELGIPATATIVGSIGRLDTPKHFSTLIEAAALIRARRSDVYFVLVGGGPQEEALRQLINARDLSAQFVLTGWRKDARVLLQAFDVFISTSIREPFGNVLVEAALAKIPVVAPSVDGIVDVVNHAQTGILLEPTEALSAPLTTDSAAVPRRVVLRETLSPPHALNPHKVAEAVLNLLESPERREQYGEAGYQKARNSFSLQHYKQTLESIYKQMYHTAKSV